MRLVDENGELVEEHDDDDVFTLTPWGCLADTLMDYGFDVSHITGKVGEHMVEDFMALMVKCGHVGRVEDE